MRNVEVKSKQLVVTFSLPNDEFYSTLSVIKTMSGAVYNPISKYWVVDDNDFNRSSLHELGFDILPLSEITYEEPQKEYDEFLLSSFPYQLREYQKTAVKFAEATNWNGILALAPRLGKSAVSMAGCLLHDDMKPVLIVCPATVKLVWQGAIEEWLHSDSLLLYGMTPYEIGKRDFVIINYEILYAWKDYLVDYGFNYLIVDESHRVGNNKTYVKNKGDKRGHNIKIKCTAAYLELAKVIKHKVLLSGTPATSSVKQLRTQLVPFIKECSKETWFLDKFCDPKKNYWTGRMEYNGFTNKEEFHSMVAPVLFRRTKEDVFDELPDELHEFIDMAIDEDLYKKELAELREETKRAHLTQEQQDEKLFHFESLSYTAKRQQILDWIKEYLSVNDKLVVFCWHKVVAEDLLKTFKSKAVMVNGSVNAVDRQKNIDAFNNNKKVNLFIGQISAVKEGITLAASDSAFFAEFGSANAGSVAQASERIWLPSLNQDKLCYYYAVGAGSEEEKRIKVLLERMTQLNSAYSANKHKQSLFGKEV